MLTLIPNKVLSFVEMICGNKQTGRPKMTHQVPMPTPPPEGIISYNKRKLQQQVSCEEAANKIKYSIRSSYTVAQLNCNLEMITTFQSRYGHTVQGKSAADSLRLALQNRFKELYDTM